MNRTSLLGWMVLALAAGAISCAKSPEGFCEDWAADTCEVLAGCCESGAKFDPDACRLSLSSSCQNDVDVELVHSGDVVFHSGAASDCAPTIEACKDFTDDAPVKFDQIAACGNVITGFRPPGAACTKASQCESSGEFSICWDGAISGTGTGVCAAVVLDEESCSFSFDDNELHMCPDEKFCDISSYTAPATAPPTSRAFEFKAACKNKIASGGKCVDDDGNGLPCADGLFCDFASAMDAQCTKRKSSGADCNGNKECAEGLSCVPNQSGPGSTCKVPEKDGPFCFKPAKCGNGDCEPSETAASCPADCGGSTGNECGDGFCDDGIGEQITCPTDCCGDGICDAGETAICPGDCGAQ